eukprot:989657_1
MIMTNTNTRSNTITMSTKKKRKPRVYKPIINRDSNATFVSLYRQWLSDEESVYKNKWDIALHQSYIPKAKWGDWYVGSAVYWTDCAKLRHLKSVAASLGLSQTIRNRRWTEKAKWKNEQPLQHSEPSNDNDEQMAQNNVDNSLENDINNEQQPLQQAISEPSDYNDEIMPQNYVDDNNNSLANEINNDQQPFQEFELSDDSDEPMDDEPMAQHTAEDDTLNDDIHQHYS